MRGWLIAPLGLALVATACSHSSDQRANRGLGASPSPTASTAGTRPAETPNPATSDRSMSSSDMGSTGAAANNAGTRPVQNPSTTMGSSTNRGSSANMTTNTNRTAASGRASAPNISKADLRQAQTQLKTMGLYTGKIDGLWGPRTRAAVGQFQAQNNIPQTNMLDSRTMEQLHSRSGAPAGDRTGLPQSGSQMGETPAAPSSGTMTAPEIENRQPTH